VKEEFGVEIDQLGGSISTCGVVIPQIHEKIRDIAGTENNGSDSEKPVHPCFLGYVGTRDELYDIKLVNESYSDINSILKESNYFKGRGIELKQKVEEELMHEVSPEFIGELYRKLAKM